MITRFVIHVSFINFAGHNVKCPHAEEIVYTLKERQYYEHIEKAYNYASKLLLDQLIEEKELLSRLRSVQALQFLLIITVKAT